MKIKTAFFACRENQPSNFNVLKMQGKLLLTAEEDEEEHGAENDSPFSTVDFHSHEVARQKWR